ncbi:hypothetical protein PGT21_017268 [Puccinia graminis f. sp. tritici]|uniref:Uncharacterized protein n=1 Tax=Puccinia graminis f. sp. tritici TaxID=56615 RepID=A0A5B0QIQ8_PUCGR|nr:hypothetical protein PGT21_017268 [Puccinia graminis f. sp. tritici]
MEDSLMGKLQNGFCLSNVSIDIKKQWTTSRQYLRVSQKPFRAWKARFPNEILDFSGLN